MRVDARLGNDDDLERQRAARAALGVRADEARDVDVAFAHARPRDGGPFGDTPDPAVANVTREHVRRQRLEREMRILDRPDGIARVEADADEFRSSGLDEHFQLARLHVAGVVLDRQLQSGVHHARADRFQNADRVVDPLFDAAGETPILETSHDAAYEQGVEDARRWQHRGDLFVGGALRRVEYGRAWTDRQHPELQIDPQRIGMRFNLAEMFGV